MMQGKMSEPRFIGLNDEQDLKVSNMKILKSSNQSNPDSDNMKQGWEIKKLKEVCAKITDGTHQTPKYFDEGYIFLSSKNVTSGKIDWENVKYIDEKQHIEMYKRVAPKVGDILLAKNGTTGVAAMVDRDVVFDIYVSLAHLSPLKNISSYYLLHFINSPLAKNQFNKRLKGAGVPNLHLEEIREVEIPLPPLPEQQRIVSILDECFAAIDKAKTNAEQNLKNAKELFESYLQGA
jgi:type I restriction enzyme S subunit